LNLRKQDLADYYQAVAELILPYLVDRPLALLRCPDGVEGEHFFQKHFQQALPPELSAVWVRDEKAAGEEGKGHSYPMVTSAAGLMRLTQLGVLEIHPWGSTARDLEHPDQLIIDLDPAPDVAMRAVVQAARWLHEDLTGLGLTSFVKTTGG